MNKKGDVDSLKLVGSLVLLLIVLVILVYVFRDNIMEIATGSKQQVTSTFGDADGDNVKDALDACPCVVGEFGNSGCPFDVNPRKLNVTEKYKDCSVEYCKAQKIKFCSE